MKKTEFPRISKLSSTQYRQHQKTDNADLSNSKLIRWHSVSAKGRSQRHLGKTDDVPLYCDTSHYLTNTLRTSMLVYIGM